MGRNILVSQSGLQQAAFFAKTSKILFSVTNWYTQKLYYMAVKLQLYVKKKNGSEIHENKQR